MNITSKIGLILLIIFFQACGNSNTGNSKGGGQLFNDTPPPIENSDEAETAKNTKPISNAGLDQFVTAGSIVKLDGSKSSDTESNPLSFNWSFISIPEGSTAVITEQDTAKPVFTPDVHGIYTLILVVNDGIENSENDTVEITSATPLSNRIENDTTWGIENSPYALTDNIQVGPDATLTIEPGVLIFGRNKKLEIFGKLMAFGTQDSKIEFESVNIIPGGGESNKLFEINISYAEINSGSIYTPSGNAVYGSLTLKNSLLTNIPYMFLWYPEKNCIIEKNIFLNTGGISTGTSDNTKIFIRNNVFYNYSGSGYNVDNYYAIENWASYNTSETIVEFNSFLNTDRITLKLRKGYNSAKMSGVNNYWSTTDNNTIEAMIYDKNDDFGANDYISFSPVLTEPHSDTPDVTSYISTNNDEYYYIEIVNGSRETLRKNEILQLVVEGITKEGDKKEITTGINWEIPSFNQDIANINSKGIIKTFGTGTIQVHAKYGQLKDSIFIEIKD